MNDSKSLSTRRNFIAAGIGLASLAGASAWWLRHRATPHFLDGIPVVDVHAHPARTFLANGEFADPVIQAMGHASEAERIADMRAGQVTASLFAIVADIQVLGLTPERGIQAYREFEPGEAYADFNRQLDYFTELAANNVLSFASNAAEVFAAEKRGDAVAILACEGGDFIEDQLDRLEVAYDRGLRSIGIVHYRPNEYGDIQTAAPVHGGLTMLGTEVVREMNRLGMLIDVAHATEATTRGIVENSDAPVMLSHSHLAHEDAPNLRLISVEHARLVSETGGVIGSWPAGITNRTMGDFVDETLRLIDAVGIDHVAVGTDLDANFRPVLTDYVQFPEFAAQLQERGLSQQEIGKVLGLNFLRVFDAATNSAATG